MMWHTHAAIGASATWCLLPFVPADGTLSISVVLACCVVGALAPDLDASDSKIKYIKVLGIEPLVPVAIGLNREFGHRGALHSARGWAVWTLLILPLAWLIGWLPIATLSLGYASHLAGDACTRTGIPLRYPRQEKFHLLPAKLRLVTGSAGEEIIFVPFACLTLTLLLNALSSGF